MPAATKVEEIGDNILASYHKLLEWADNITRTFAVDECINEEFPRAA